MWTSLVRIMLLTTWEVGLMVQWAGDTGGGQGSEHRGSVGWALIQAQAYDLWGVSA